MVLQRDATVPVWGDAPAGTRVTVRFAGQSVEAAADSQGRWLARLAPMNTSFEPRDLIIETSAGQIHTLAGVLVGDVYLLAGQSNMAWPLDRSAGAAAAKAQANYPWLRVFHQAPGKGASDTPARDVIDGAWSTCTPENAGKISGVGFFFARELHPHVQAPIGLIHTAMGGTRIESWLDQPTLNALPGTGPYYQLLKRAEENYARDEAAFKIRQDEYARTRTGPWPEFGNALGVDRQKRPSALFYGKVAPLQPMALRGVLWYQGEGNSSNDPTYYQNALISLIGLWRKGFEQPELPFLIVQLPNYAKGDQWPGTREAQRRVAQGVPNVGLVVTLDLGEAEQIHPANKLDVGARTARLAQSLIYSQPVVASGPIATSAVRFDHPGQGLQLESGTAVGGLEIRDATGKFKAVEGRITAANEITIQAPDATLVRYAWAAMPAGANLQNSDLLPAAAFMLDVATGRP
jgi:sialate O-acetylesterase